MLINEYSRHSAIRPAPHPPSPASSPRIPHPPSPSPHPQKGRNADLFSSRLPHSIVVCTKGDKFNSFLWQGCTDTGRKRLRRRRRGGWRKRLPRREQTANTKKIKTRRKKKVAEFEVSHKEDKERKVESLEGVGRRWINRLRFADADWCAGPITWSRRTWSSGAREEKAVGVQTYILGRRGSLAPETNKTSIVLQKKQWTNTNKKCNSKWH